MALAAAAQAENPAPAGAAAPAAQTEMQKWLADLDAQWQAAFKRDVSDAYTAENDKLRGQYVAALEAGITKASGAGDLNAAIVWRNEQKRFAEASGIPAQDDAADPLPVKQLRAAWRSQLPRIETERAARAKALLAKYDQVLASAQTQLTKGTRIDDALLVKAKRDEVAAAWITPATAAALGTSGLATTPAVKTPAAKTENHNRTGGAPKPPPSGRVLLSKENEHHWKEVKGEWKIENGVMTGNGESYIDFPVSISPPFKLWFTIKVMEGIRGGMFFGPLSFGNDQPTSFHIWPRHEGDATVPYERNTPYKVSIIVSQKTVELYVDDKLITTVPGFKDRLDKLRFTAGDGWSKGRAEFRDIVLSK